MPGICMSSTTRSKVLPRAAAACSIDSGFGAARRPAPRCMPQLVEEWCRIVRFVSLSSTRARAGPADSRAARRGACRRAACFSKRAVNQKVEPLPGSLLTPISPPMSWTRAACRWRGRGRCRRSGASSSRRPARRPGTAARCVLGGDADAGVGDVEADDASRSSLLAAAATAHHDLALLGELDRVADQVGEDLAQRGRGSPRSAAARRCRRRDAQLEALRRGARGEQLDRAFDHACRSVEVDLLEGQLAGLDLGEVEDVVDDGEQRLGAAGDGLREVRAASASSPVSSSRSVMPMTPFIGVRISWLMLARNSDFSRADSSAASRACLIGLLGFACAP